MAEFATSQVTIFNWFNNGWSELIFWSEYWSYGTSTKHATYGGFIFYLYDICAKLLAK